MAVCILLLGIINDASNKNAGYWTAPGTNSLGNIFLYNSTIISEEIWL